jgi:hypothetical protein
MILDCRTGDQALLHVVDRVTGEPLSGIDPATGAPTGPLITYADDARGFYRAAVRGADGRLLVNEARDGIRVEEVAADVEVRLRPKHAGTPSLRRWYARRREGDDVPRR